MGDSGSTRRRPQLELRSGAGAGIGALDVVGFLLLGERIEACNRWLGLDLPGLKRRRNSPIITSGLGKGRQYTVELFQDGRHNRSLVPCAIAPVPQLRTRFWALTCGCPVEGSPQG